MSTRSYLHPPVDASWAQTGVLGVNHVLAGADRVYGQVTGVGPVVIPRAGIWLISYQARSGFVIPLNTAANLFVTTALAKNGAIVVGTEAISGIGTGAGPIASQQETQGLTFVNGCAAGDVWTMHAYRIGQVGDASVISNGDGRTRITAWWIGPEGDTAS